MNSKIKVFTLIALLLFSSSLLLQNKISLSNTSIKTDYFQIESADPGEPPFPVDDDILFSVNFNNRI